MTLRKPARNSTWTRFKFMLATTASLLIVTSCATSTATRTGRSQVITAPSIAPMGVLKATVSDTERRWVLTAKGLARPTGGGTWSSVPLPVGLAANQVDDVRTFPNGDTWLAAVGPTGEPTLYQQSGTSNGWKSHVLTAQWPPGVSTSAHAGLIIAGGYPYAATTSQRGLGHGEADAERSICTKRFRWS